MSISAGLATIAEFEAHARRESLPSVLFDRLFGSYGDPGWVTNTTNVAAFEAVKLRPRVMVDVTHRDLSTEVLGHKISFPVILSPAGPQQRAHPDGELGSARAAGAARTMMGISTLSSYSIEEVIQAATGPIWFQLYFLQDRELTKNLVERADKAGYAAVVLTVDTKLEAGLLGRGGSKDQKYRYDYALEPGRNIKNFDGVNLPNIPTIDTFMESRDPALDWSHLAWLRSITRMPLIIKGIQTAEDAWLCVEHGVDGLVVSNHGGFALQGTLGTIDMLPEVVDVVGDRLEVFLDGGVRLGSDVLKALALGAKAVLIGRAVFWGLAVEGEVGVARVLEILRDELKIAMGLCGVPTVRDVSRNLVVTPNDRRAVGDVVGELERLARLLEQGYITRDEYENIKTSLIRQ